MKPLERLVADGLLEEKAELGPLTTYKFGGPARYLMTATGADSLRRLAEALVEEPLPVLPLGKGSNVLVASSGFDGVVVHIGTEMAWVEIADEMVVAGAGTSLPLLARRTAAADRGGLEFLVGIPGSVGGAVRMNAGCHGSETGEWLDAARIIDLTTAEETERTAAGLALSYRSSNLSSTELVLSARFRTVDRPREEAEEVIREITRWRRDNQPGGTFNAGSVFKNPPGDAAGRVIDEIGLKGLAVGGASVSDRHANFIVAGGDATPEDVHALVGEVRRRVAEATGIDLEPEIRFVGDFTGVAS